MNKRQKTKHNEQKYCAYCATCSNKSDLNCVTCSCGNWICANCAQKNLLYLDDWLSADIHCCRCDAYVCMSCVRICYECENDPDSHGDSSTYCSKCSKMQTMDVKSTLGLFVRIINLQDVELVKPMKIVVVDLHNNIQLVKCSF
jgi:hypothetical protein